MGFPKKDFPLWIFSLLLASSVMGEVKAAQVLGRKLLKPVMTAEGAVPAPTLIEDAAFCRNYSCVGLRAPIGDTGFSTWLIADQGMRLRSDEVITASEQGKFYPELTVNTSQNTVTYTELVFDTAVRSTLAPATLNLLGNFTRLVLGTPISGQKLAGCYRRLKTEPVCTVGGGKIRLVGGALKTFKAWFRVRDDEGDINVIYAIELEG